MLLNLLRKSIILKKLSSRWSFSTLYCSKGNNK